MHHHPVNLVEFCAGYCGIGIGLKSVVRNLRTIAYVEREAYPAANLAAKIEAGRLDAAPIWSDLLDFPYGKFRGLVDIAAAGIPCQPHSHAGLRKGGATSDSFLATGCEDSSKCGQDASSSKMSKGCSPVRCQMELFASGGRWRDWNAWATGLRAAYSARRNAARHILGSVSGFWPTPTANEDKDQNASFATLARLDKGGRILRRIATLAMRGNGQVGQMNLNDGGSRRERLNPAWVESLLGLPSSWTDCASSETESCQQPPHSHSEL
jgi:hypothetical protein